MAHIQEQVTAHFVILHCVFQEENKNKNLDTYANVFDFISKIRQIISQIHRLLGSSAALGNPVGLVNNLGTGVTVCANNILRFFLCKYC